MQRRQLNVSTRGPGRPSTPLSRHLNVKLREVAEDIPKNESVNLTGRVCHIVGNGESCVNFKKISETDFALGCNQPFVAVDATFICDHKFLYKIRENRARVTVPVVAPQKLVSWIRSNPKAKNTPAEHLEILDVYDYGDQRIPSHSSAHYGAIWLAKSGSTEVHVWGCDSLVENTIKSKTDSIVDNPQKDNPGHGQKFAERWRANWIQVTQWYPHVTFVFHNIHSGNIHDAR